MLNLHNIASSEPVRPPDQDARRAKQEQRREKMMWKPTDQNTRTSTNVFSFAFLPQLDTQPISGRTNNSILLRIHSIREAIYQIANCSSPCLTAVLPTYQKRDVGLVLLLWVCSDDFLWALFVAHARWDRCAAERDSLSS